jgi:hypothetical protein
MRLATRSWASRRFVIVLPYGLVQSNTGPSLAEARSHCVELKVIGSYPRAERVL